MANVRGALLAFVLVTLTSVAAGLFRVATAPDRIRDRHHVAHTVCVSVGGEWTVVDRAEICRRPDALLLPWQQPETPKAE